MGSGRTPRLRLRRTVVAVAAPRPTPPWGLVGCAGSSDLTVTTFQSGVHRPWDLAFLPDGSLLSTERIGNIGLRATDGTLRTLIDPSDPDADPGSILQVVPA